MIVDLPLSSSNCEACDGMGRVNLVHGSIYGSKQMLGKLSVLKK